MVKKTCILLSAILAIFCCSPSNSKDHSESTDSTEEPDEIKTFSFLALGDSYTVGQGVEPFDSWPFQLKTALDVSNKKIDTLTVIAKTGWTTRNLLNAIEEEEPKKHDLVSLLIGVNNQFQRLSYSEFQTEFDKLLAIAIDLAEDKRNVIIVSIPDYGVTPFGSNNSEVIAQELDNYNSFMEQQASLKEIPFINITEISRELANSETALADDNLHPSGFQYSLWIEKILPIALEILK